LIQVNQAFGPFLLKVDLKMWMVDQDKGYGRPEWSTIEFKARLYLLWYRMTDRRKSNDDNKKKLTKIVSTKLSIEDDNLLQQFADFVYKAGIIRASAKSDMLRVMVTHVLSDFKKKTGATISSSKSENRI
jgi:hypothetical protein